MQEDEEHKSEAQKTKGDSRNENGTKKKKTKFMHSY